MANVKILVVEDDAIEAMDIKRTLESFGYSVPYVASEGEEAVEKVFELMPDLVLMDIILKDEHDGIEVAYKIKELDIPLIYLTAHSERSTVKDAKLTEPYGYLIKPYDSLELKFAIELALFKNESEIKLKESEKKFRYILENSLEAAYRRNLDAHEYDYLSPVIEQILGYSAENFISMPETKIMELIHPEDRETVNTFYNDAFSGKIQTYNNEYRFKQKSGNYKWVNDYGSIVHEDNCTFMVGSVRDIDDRKKSAQKFKDTEEKFSKAFHSNVVAMNITDDKGRYIDVNDSFCHLTGFERDELLGHTAGELNIVDSPKIKEKLSEVSTNTIKGKESFITTKSGKKHVIRSEVQQFETNNQKMFISSIEEITRQKKVEIALEKERRRFFDVLETMPVMVCILDPDYNIIYANQSFKAKFGESHGRPCYEYCFGLEEPCDFCEVFTVLETGQPHHWEVSAPDGTAIEVHDYPYTDYDGSPLVLEVDIDVTEYREAQNSLSDALNEKKILIREIHHRVKNNMQIIASLLNLQKSFVDDENTNNVLKESQNRIKSMAMVHERLYQSPDLTHINISEYIGKLVVDLFYSYSIFDDQVTVTLEIDDLNLNVETAIPCGLLINEIVSNSLKYAFPESRKGNLSISLKARDKWNELIISDDGVGFPEELDFKNTTTLGLQLVNNLVEQLEGEIILDRSQSTSFKIRFKELEYIDRV